MEKLGWKAEKVFTSHFSVFNYAYIREFPIIGSFIKILRVKPPLQFQEIDILAKKFRAFKVQIEPEIINKKIYVNNSGYTKSKTPLAPTKTILIDLTRSKEAIFNSFSPEKRRAVRKALKNGIVVKQSLDIKSFIKLKNKQLWPFGFLLSNEIKKLWEVFKPAQRAVLLLAYAPNANIVSGVLLLFYDKMAYYWLASSTNTGKKLFAPSLLVCEALKLSQKKGCKTFDFEGVEDKRFKETKTWAGFTKFKNGFGGKEIAYADPLQKLFWPIR